MVLRGERESMCGSRSKCGISVRRRGRPEEPTLSTRGSQETAGAVRWRDFFPCRATCQEADEMPAAAAERNHAPAPSACSKTMAIGTSWRGSGSSNAQTDSGDRRAAGCPKPGRSIATQGIQCRPMARFSPSAERRTKAYTIKLKMLCIALGIAPWTQPLTATARTRLGSHSSSHSSNSHSSNSSHSSIPAQTAMHSEPAHGTTSVHVESTHSVQPAQIPPPTPSMKPTKLAKVMSPNSPPRNSLRRQARKCRNAPERSCEPSSIDQDFGCHTVDISEPRPCCSLAE